MIGEDATLLDHLATLGVQQAEMAVAVADVDAGGKVVVVLGHGRSPPSCGSALDLRSSTCVIVGFARSIISAFSSHLYRGYAYFRELRYKPTHKVRDSLVHQR